jgi:hypothetical protein
MPLHGEQLPGASVVVRDGQEIIAEIRDLHLCNARFRPGARPLIGCEVPLPLFWEQYAHHEDPERNTGSNARASLVSSTGNRVTVVCTGTTRSGSAESLCEVSFMREDGRSGYTIQVDGTLRIAQGHTWIVSPNPAHGEVEFCNLWPDGVFSVGKGKAVRYQGCYIERNGSVVKVPLHHVESADKHNIPLGPGDRMVWLLDDDNLCVALRSQKPVAAGICAYMWDAHLGYRVCDADRDVALSSGTQIAASFRLSSVDRMEGRALVLAAHEPISPELSLVPVVLDEVHTFAISCAQSPLGPVDTWPWETEVTMGDRFAVAFDVDHTEGWDDTHALRIDARTSVRAMWKATTLGPAFRQPDFAHGERYRLVAYVKTRLTAGSATIAIRFHRSGDSGLFDPQQYSEVRCPLSVPGMSGWRRLDVITPPVVPVADRVHLLLEMDGQGICWFDNVHVTRER